MVEDAGPLWVGKLWDESLAKKIDVLAQKGKEIANSFKIYFDNMWKIARKT